MRTWGSRWGSVFAIALAMLLQACATAPLHVSTVSSASAQTLRSGPALWKVADEDTTIYLFGTVHALPKDVDWYTGPIARALSSADTLVTEIPANSSSDPAAAQMIAGKAVLPAGKSLRDLLPEQDRTTYETAMTSIGLPVEAFDRFKPWFAGMQLAVLPLMKQGWTAESGVEHVIEMKAGPKKARDALETVDYQIGLFDELPRASQIAFLMASAGSIDTIVPQMDQMVDDWMAGDADGLAALMNEGMDDPALARALLYDRNANWAAWIAKRLDRPGTVFIAVGAGHLAGDKSVQSFLEARAIPVARIQ
jgi:uncharacterized protein YbaP (TraB family)